MKSTKTIAAGEQMFNDYGPLPRSDLLRMYGYVTDNYAKYDGVELSHDTLLEVAGKKHDNTNKAWLKREEQLDELGSSMMGTQYLVLNQMCKTWETRSQATSICSCELSVHTTRITKP
jgi:SET domain-containing protein 6